MTTHMSHDTHFILRLPVSTDFETRSRERFNSSTEFIGIASPIMLSHLTFPSKRVFAVTARMNIRPMSSMPKSGTWIDKELGYDTCCLPHTAWLRAIP